MTTPTKKEYPGGIIVQDYGREEYLDGILMQYAVMGKKGDCAYFSTKEDAHLFAKAKSAGLK